MGSEDLNQTLFNETTRQYHKTTRFLAKPSLFFEHLYTTITITIIIINKLKKKKKKQVLLLVYYIHLHLCRFTPKVLVNQSGLLEMITCPRTNPITSPLAYPTTTTFQLNPSPNDDSCLGSKVSISIFPHFLDIGKPHNPEFPSNEEFSNVANCLP